MKITECKAAPRGSNIHELSLEAETVEESAELATLTLNLSPPDQGKLRFISKDGNGRKVIAADLKLWSNDDFITEVGR